MTIYFHNIQGISKEDTPVFETLALQTEYFQDNVTYTIEEDAFYPPHSHIDLRVDTDDINFNSPVNYISFEYQDKWYYYFISSYRYVNESLISFSLDMDTIQTYMFSTTNIIGNVERYTINNSFDLSQYHYRENPSMNKNYKVVDKKDDMNEGVTVDLILCYPGDSSKVSTTITTNLRNMMLPYTIIFHPMHKTKTISYMIDLNTDTKYSFDNIIDMYSSTYTMKIFTGIPIEYFIPQCIITTKDDVTGIEIPKQDGIYFYSASYLYKTYPCIAGINYENVISKSLYTYSMPFTYRNIKKEKDNPWYHPYLLSMGCVRLRYGEMDNMEEVDFNKNNSLTPTIYYFFDIETGTRCYWNTSIKNINNKFLYTSSSCELGLATTQYIEYQENNKNTKQTALALGAMQTVLGLGIGASGNMIGGATGLFKGASQLASTVSKINDLQSAPGKMQNSATALTTLIRGDIRCIISLEQVDDLDECLLYFEQYGVMINKQYNITSILDMCKSRYYYNFTKWNSLTPTFNLLMSEQLRDDFVQRLKDGVRFWNIKEINIGNYEYNNINYEEEDNANG